MLADLRRAGHVFGGGPGQVNGLGAGLVDFPGAGAAGTSAERAHVQ
jgi:hypothetical protein